MAKQAWLFLAYGDERVYGGNDGYDDRRDRYSFDSQVPNWKRVTAGDFTLIASRDCRGGPPMGTAMATVSRITREAGTKVMRRCPSCGHPRFKERLTKQPRWRCDFGHEFDEPTTETRDVTAVTAWFDDSYRELPHRMPFTDIRLAQVHERDANAIRPLDVGVLERKLRQFT